MERSQKAHVTRTQSNENVSNYSMKVHHSLVGTPAKIWSNYSYPHDLGVLCMAYASDVFKSDIHSPSPSISTPVARG